LADLAGRGYVSEDSANLEDPAAECSRADAPGEDASVADISGGGSFVKGDSAGEVPAESSLDIHFEDVSVEDASTEAVPAEDASAGDDPDRLVIEVPLTGFTDTALDNLEKLVASKAALIMKSIEAETLPIMRQDDRLCFPWFTLGSSHEETHAYTQFIHALCDMAKKQRRVVAKEKPADSEKFAFRCFLLRLGFIGDEFATARKILLANLPGDGSFKSGKRKDQGEDAPVAANAADSGADSEGESGSGESESAAHGADNGREEGAFNPYPLAEALADAELIHGVNMLLETEMSGGAVNE